MTSCANNFGPLLKLLLAVEDEEGIHIDEAISDGTLWKFFPISTVNEMLDRISTIQLTLEALTVGVKNTATSLKSQVPKRAKRVVRSRRSKRLNGGLLSLPNEVLCSIAKEIQRVPSSEHWLTRALLPFSQTCRKIRKATLSFPTLWTTIMSQYPDSQVGAYLARSRDLPLDVSLTIPKSYNSDFLSLKSFIEKIVPSSKRWRSFRLYMSTLVVDPRLGFFLRLLKDNVTILPMLQSLSIHLKDPDVGEEVLNAVDSFHFYTGWMMPDLRTFDFMHFIPRQFSCQTVTSMKVTLDCTGGQKAISLLDFLKKSPQVEDLSLHFTRIGDIESIVLPVSLQKLNHLEIFSHGQADGYLYLSDFLMNLIFPNLTHVKASLEYTAEFKNVIKPWIFSLCAHGRFSKVTDFEVNICQLIMKDDIGAGFLFENLPRLENLSIEFVDAWPPSLWGESFVGIPPKLRSVSIAIDDAYADSITPILKETKVKELKYTQSSSFIGAEIVKCFPETTFNWHKELRKFAD